MSDFPFYESWIRHHHAMDTFGWSDAGFDPSISDFTREVQVLGAVCYGREDIFNGGFHQFFGNVTGTFAPEMIEWFEQTGLQESANVMKDAIAVFGPQFPRSYEERDRFLEQFRGTRNPDRDAWDPFSELNVRFENTFPGIYEDDGDTAFRDAADRWLKEVCGIRSLHDDGKKE